MKNVLPGGGGGLGILGILIVIGLGVLGWLATGVYIVDEGRGEVGVELVLGKVTDQTGTGFHYNWPYPIGEVYKPQVEQQRETTVGVEELFTNTGAVRSRDVPEESLMLTGDENIVDVGFKVQWRIKTPVMASQTSCSTFRTRKALLRQLRKARCVRSLANPTLTRS